MNRVESDPLDGAGRALEVPGWYHSHSGHCESGVAASLLTHHGLPMSEPMAFGLSSSLIFAHIPFVKVGGLPLTAYRAVPGHVLRRLERRLSLRLGRRRFRDRGRAQEELDRALVAGRPVGLQTSVFWLSYFPEEMRFHFNAHNLVVVGREANGDYRISDPVFETLQYCDPTSLEQARFARGVFAPRGLMYWVESVPSDIDYARVVPAAIRQTMRMNRQAPVPLVGVRAIRRLARTIARLGQRGLEHRQQALFIGQIIRMQEEIGTGGAGFRYMYASFLQEAAALLQDEALDERAREMTAVGDQWRQFALMGAEFCRQAEGADLARVAEALRASGEAEDRALAGLGAWLRQWRRGGAASAR